MAFEKEKQSIDAIAEKHADVPVQPEFSTPAARLLERRCRTTNVAVPLVIRRFQDRAEGPKGQDGAHNKIGRDFYGTDYNRLTPDKQAQVSSLHSSLVNDAPEHPYLKPGLTFIQARHLLVETYRDELTNRYPQEIQAALCDFRDGLEKDIDEAAKHAGFYSEYSKANQNLKSATAPPHNARQSLPMTARK